MRILPLFIFAFLFLGVHETHAFGSELLVSPHTFEIDMERGQVYEGVVRVKNNSEVVIPLANRVSDFTAQEETGQIIFDDSLSSRFWYDIRARELLLDPGQTGRIPFSITVPEETEPGGYYATLRLEPQFPEFYFQEGQARVIPTVGVLFLLVVERDELESAGLAVSEFSVSREFYIEQLQTAFFGGEAFASHGFPIIEKSSFPLEFQIQNRNPYHVKLQGDVAVYSSLGLKIGNVHIPDTTILPFKSRNAAIQFAPELPLWAKSFPVFAQDVMKFFAEHALVGKYYAVLSVEAAEGDTITKRFDFWIFPWKTVTLLAIFLILVVLLRNRLMLALRVLARRS